MEIVQSIVVQFDASITRKKIDSDLAWVRKLVGCPIGSLSIEHHDTKTNTVRVVLKPPANSASIRGRIVQLLTLQIHVRSVR